MKQQLRQFILFVMFLPPVLAFGQTQTHTTNTNCPGVPGACGYPVVTTNPNARSGPNAPAPQNGNGTLGVIYDQSRCGLDFTSASQRLGKRFTPQGINQPAPFVISGIPACAVIEKAYLWAEGSGNGMAQTATVNGPAGSANYPMAIVGQGPDKCWGYSGSYTYRADVTASVNGNGTYNISGILTNPPTAGNDMDGATLLVIWSVPSASFQGRIVIADGAIVVNGGTSNYNMPISPAVCGATTGARAFCGIGDIQMAVGSLTCNGTPTPITWNWWNFQTVNTTVATGATTANFNCSTGGDCFNFCIAGLYFRTTTCATCPTTTAFTVTPSSTPATCSACNGTGSVTVSPAGSYTYTWSPAPGGGQGTANATGLCAGNYIVTVVSACATITATVTVGNSGGGVTSTPAQTNITCNGACTGSATVTVTSGTAPYTYSWSPAPGGGQGTSIATGLCAGTYVCNITDAIGCTGSQSFTITQAPPITFTQSQVDVSCNGACDGTASVVASGGVGTYTYTWSPAPGGGQGTPNATGLCAGPYTCTISSGPVTCTTVASFNITQPPPVTATQSQVNVDCNGACNGSASVVASGGTGTYTYNWIPAPGGGQGTANATGLCAGVYTCEISSPAGCSIIQSFTITQPPPLSATQSQTDVTCFGACNGAAFVFPAGGTGTYTYLWTPAPGSGQGSPNATGMCPGAYTCQVSSPAGCSVTQSFNITEPPLLTLAAAGFNVTCYGSCDGQIVVIPTGGTPPYSFLWSTGCTNASCSNICAGSYNVTVTDLNGCTATASVIVTEPSALVVSATTIDANCNQSDGSASATFSGGTGTLTPVWYNPQQAPGPDYLNIPAGSYFVVVTDQNGCDDTVNVMINNLAGVVASPGALTNVACNGGNNGSFTVLDNGVNSPYTYAWTCSASATGTASSLGAGACSVTLTDVAGCQSTVNFTITEPPPLTLTATATPGTICQGQSVQMSGTSGGGTPAYQYAWMPGPLPGLTQTITPQATGTYTLYITDANNCVDSSTVTVTVNTIPVATLSGDSLSGCAAHCVNFSDLSTISAGTISGWSWDFGDGNTSTSQNPSHCYFSAGNFTVILTVTTAIGCSNTITMPNYISVYGLPVAEFSMNPQPTTELNPTIYFTDLSTGASSWSWSFGDLFNSSSTLQNPSFTYPGPGCFDALLTVQTQNGCEDTTLHQVCIEPDVAIFVPNAFTPNGDGVNETFFAQGIGIDPEKFEMWVFDRWGNLIFYTDDMSKSWDGSVQGKGGDISQVDTYVWKIRAVDMNGQKHNIVGGVSLIR